MNHTVDLDALRDRRVASKTVGSDDRNLQIQQDESTQTEIEAAGQSQKGLDLLELLLQTEERKQQMKLIQALLDNPTLLNVKNDMIPCSTSPEEIEQRKDALRYRIDMLKVLLNVTEHELEMLSRASTERPDSVLG